MSKKIRWLVITPTLGRSPFMHETISSCSYLPGDVEHIIVCPTEERNKILVDFPNLQVTAESNSMGGGMYGAINDGIISAKNKYDFFCYLNDDDFYLADISKIVNLIENDQDVIYYGKTMMVDANRRLLYQAPFAHFSRLIPLFLKNHIIPFMQPSMIVPYSVMEKLVGFDSSYRYCGDLDFILRAVSIGVKFRLIDFRISAFRLHKGQLSSFSKKMSDETNQAYEKLGFKLLTFKLNYFIVKFMFSLTNIRSYIDRFKTTRKLTNKQVFYDSNLR